MVNPNKPLRNIDEAYCCALAESFHAYNCYCARGLMNAYFPSTVNPKSAANQNDVHNIDLNKLLKESLCMVMLDWCHQRSSVQILEDKNG